MQPSQPECGVIFRSQQWDWDLGFQPHHVTARTVRLIANLFALIRRARLVGMQQIPGQGFLVPFSGAESADRCEG